MANKRQILQEIEALSFKEKMELTTKLLETYLKELPGQENIPEENQRLPLDEAMTNLRNQSKGNLSEDDTISSGFTSLDKHMGGFRKGSLTIIAGRPNMGKRDFVLNLVRKMLSLNKVVGFVSIDLTSEQLARKLLQLYSGVSASETLTKEQHKKLEEAKSTIRAQSFHHVDVKKVYPGIHDILEVCRSMAIENQVEALFIDYLQLINWDLEMPDSSKSDTEHVITELKRFAHEYNIALIVTSGLTRGVDLRSGDKRPMLSDLSDMTRSDMIEELADNILLLHRPAYYGIIEDEHGNDLMNRTEVIIARSKDGYTGNIYFRNDFQSLINVSST